MSQNNNNNTNPTLDFTRFFDYNKYDQKKFLEMVEARIKKYQKAYDTIKAEKMDLERQRDLLLNDLSTSVPAISRDELEKENSKNKKDAEMAIRELESTQAKLLELEKNYALAVEEKAQLEKILQLQHNSKKSRSEESKSMLEYDTTKHLLDSDGRSKHTSDNLEEWIKEIEETKKINEKEKALLDKINQQENLIEELVAENSRLVIELYMAKNAKATSGVQML